MKRTHKGAAIVEFALILPLLLLLIFIVTEFGRALYQYNVLTKAVRDAARYLSTQESWTTANWNTAANAAVQLTAANLIVHGNPAGSGAPLAIGLSSTNVGWYNGNTSANDAWQPAGTAPAINTVTISIINYTFTPIISSAFGVNFANIPFATISATMRGVR